MHRNTNDPLLKYILDKKNRIFLIALAMYFLIKIAEFFSLQIFVIFFTTISLISALLYFLSIKKKNVEDSSISNKNKRVLRIIAIIPMLLSFLLLADYFVLNTYDYAFQVHSKQIVYSTGFNVFNIYFDQNEETFISVSKNVYEDIPIGTIVNLKTTKLSGIIKEVKYENENFIITDYNSPSLLYRYFVFLIYLVPSIYFLDSKYWFKEKLYKILSYAIIITSVPIVLTLLAEI